MYPENIISVAGNYILDVPIERVDDMDGQGDLTEFEITPDMIAAGVSALYATSDYFDLAEDRVATIYRAMVKREAPSPSALEIED